MKKVIVIGCPGSGKSTLARALAERLGLPLIHLDMLYWRADGTSVPKEVFRERLLRAMEGERWIIDGNYASTMELRLRACDTAIFLDYPTELCLRGVRERRGKPRSDMPWVETGEDREFLSFIEKYRAESRPRVLELLAAYGDRRITILHSRQEADAYIEALSRG